MQSYVFVTNPQPDSNPSKFLGIELYTQSETLHATNEEVLWSSEDPSPSLGGSDSEISGFRTNQFYFGIQTYFTASSLQRERHQFLCNSTFSKYLQLNLGFEVAFDLPEVRANLYSQFTLEVRMGSDFIEVDRNEVQDSWERRIQKGDTISGEYLTDDGWWPCVIVLGKFSNATICDATLYSPFSLAGYVIRRVRFCATSHAMHVSGRFLNERPTILDT